jgi:hypothetical protein
LALPDFIIPRLEKLDSQPEVQKLLLGIKDYPGVQTFLWTGPEGTGKRTYALAWVRSLFCKEGLDCPGCATCKQVLNKTHSDLFWVHREHFWAEDDKEKSKTETTVKVIRRLTDKLNQAPLSAPYKVAIVPAADEMNEEAQNIFLKTLEEPPSNTFVVLLAEKSGNFISTVLSRCRPIRFPQVPFHRVEEILVKDQGWTREDAKKASLECRGNITLALRAADPVWMDFRQKVQEDWDRGLGGNEEDWLMLANEYDQWEPDILDDRERTATQRKSLVLQEAFSVVVGLWERRLLGEAPIPERLKGFPPIDVLKSVQRHQDLANETTLSLKMVMDHLFMELRDGLKRGGLAHHSVGESAVQII